MINNIFESRLVLTAVDGRLEVQGPKLLLDELRPIIRQWKHELLTIVTGKSVRHVGQCRSCGDNLIGLPVNHDGYLNRVCGACGRWAICLPPRWSPDDLAEHIGERAAIMKYDGGLTCDDAGREAVESVRAEFEKQKSIFDDADRIVYDSKGGRQSGKTDDRVTQLSKELNNHE